MLPNMGCLVPLSPVEGKFQSVPLSSLMGFQLEIDNRFPRFQQVSQEALTPPQHSNEWRQTNKCPPRDTICCIESNICVEQNIYFVDAD